jgi:hypothetical protein
VDVLPVRSHNEALVYILLRPCRACGADERDLTDELTVAEGDVLAEHTSFCLRCQHIDRYTFRLPGVDPQDGESGVAFGGPEPSTIIDAGQWLAFADRTANSRPVEPDGLSLDDRADAALALRAAAEAVREVIKFIPADEDRVSYSSLWTAEGRAEFDKDPWRMSRQRMTAVADAYERAAVRMAGGRPIWSR